MDLRKGDKVIVIAGRDKGVEGFMKIVSLAPEVL